MTLKATVLKNYKSAGHKKMNFKMAIYNIG